VKISYHAVKMRAELGASLKHARARRGLSLERASAAAAISQGYLHKLEAGRVNNPSPRVLQRLAEVLDAPYARLMELAGYFVPAGARAPEAPLARSEPTNPMSASPTATNAELLRRLEAMQAELAALNAGQQRLAEALERLAPARR
jgi:transcriptional regulator with XRE-family HTH domain